MAMTEVQGRAAHYREWGSGNHVLLMLHGWPADSTHYQELGPLLAKQGYRVIVPDFPGWGKTPVPPKAWKVSDYRDWVHDFAQTLELSQFWLFGHSFGGRVGIKYAIKYAPDLKGLILCAAAGIKTDPYTAKRRLLKLTASLGKKTMSLPGLKKLAPAARKVLYRIAGSTDYLQAEGIMKETIVQVLEEDLTPLLPQVHLTTTLIWGDEDKATPLSDGKRMQEMIPHAKLTVIKGAPHNLPRHRPEELAKAIAESQSLNPSAIQ